MAADISATGTWTTITNFPYPTTTFQQPGVSIAPDSANVPTLFQLNFENLKTAYGEGVILPEVDQFITLMAQGYNIGYWHAASLLQILLRAAFNRDSVPDVMRVYP